jgi:rRNA small subunit pseudouridine methyltransferase Nep1
LKLKIRAAETSELLLKVIKNPVIEHLPMGAPIITCSEKSRLVDMDEYCNSLGNKTPVFIVGAISKGDVVIDYAEDSISVSSYPLSAAVVCSKLCNSFEKVWDVL